MTTQYDGFHPDSYSSLTNPRGHHQAVDPGQQAHPRLHPGGTHRDHDSSYVQAVIDRNNRLRQGPAVDDHESESTAPQEEYANDPRHLPSHEHPDDRHRPEPVSADHEGETIALQDEQGRALIGSSLFGWLTATSIVGLLTALLAAIMW